MDDVQQNCTTIVTYYFCIEYYHRRRFYFESIAWATYSNVKLFFLPNRNSQKRRILNIPQ